MTILNLHTGELPTSAKRHKSLHGRAKTCLTPGEEEVMVLLAKGMTYKHIAIACHCSESTVYQRVMHICQFYFAYDRYEAVEKWKQVTK